MIAVKRFGLGWDYDQKYRRAIQTMTREEILRAVRRHIDPDNMGVVIVGPAK
jgi:predicted Zn-dependent peptidase